MHANGRIEAADSKMMDQRIKEASDRHLEIESLRTETLRWLVNCFHPDARLFYTSLEGPARSWEAQGKEPIESSNRHLHEPPPPPTVIRDTAMVLTAIEGAWRGLMPGGPRPKPASSEKSKMFLPLEDRDLPHRDDYTEHVYELCMKDTIYAKAINGVGQPDGLLQHNEPFGTPDAFSCGLILELLCLNSNPKTYSRGFVEALDSVLSELCKLYPPVYAFGGASITDSEPHAFVSYTCLRGLESIVGTMRQSKLECERLAKLLDEVYDWYRAPSEGNIQTKLTPTRVIYRDFDAFRQHLHGRLAGSTTGLGQWAIKNHLVASLESAKSEDASPVAGALKVGAHQATEWLKEFKQRVKEYAIGPTTAKLVTLKNDLLADCLEDGTEGGRAAGFVNDARNNRISVGLCRKMVFFEGMRGVLDEVANIYSELGNSSSSGDPATYIESFARGVERVGKLWAHRVQRTEAYIHIFSRWATAELYRQLGLGSVPYKTNFDPVQMAFLARIYNDYGGQQKNPQIIARAMHLFFESQQEDGTWPSGAPFWLDSRTQIAIHVSNIEIINAIIPLLKGQGKTDRFVDNLDRIFQWLKMNRRKVTFTHPASHKEAAVEGWSTDKIFERGRIDVWMTALVLRFLTSYADFLQKFINDAVLADYDTPKPTIHLSDLIDPRLSLPYDKRFTTRIRQEYVHPFLTTGKGSKTAMILYGPPGTAKTTIAKAIAGTLGWGLVIITPSDFVKQGIEKSEDMARRLFKDLRRLKRTVVFFDEIDEMLRTRAEGERPTGIGMLHFLIPGMLPKLQDLKEYGEKAGVILIIATNYYDRLDSAIVRAGRMDDKFLIPPPDESSRWVQLYGFLKKAKGGISPWRYQDDLKLWEAAEALAKLTPGWVYKEMEYLVGKLAPDDLNFLSSEPLEFHQDKWIVRTGIEKEEISRRGLNLQEFYAKRENYKKVKEELQKVLEACHPAWPEAGEQQEWIIESILGSRRD